ncbi:hypothetical protein VTK56DRAFT_7932 [Thermocarpiscus australiensis]
MYLPRSPMPLPYGRVPLLQACGHGISSSTRCSTANRHQSLSQGELTWILCNSNMPQPDHQPHPFGPGRTVAVIGAGISGVCAAAHLLKQGLRVTVYERAGAAGGVWRYDERTAEDPPYPNNTPSQGDYRVSQRGEFAYATPPPELHGDGRPGVVGVRGTKNISDLEVHFSPPGPCYAGLKNNVPTYLMATALGPWPEGTEPMVSHEILEQYIQTLARNHGVDAVTLYHTRVDEARKTRDGTKWEIRSVTLEKDGESGARLTEKMSHFDLLVVASGHYNMPRVPDIEGLSDWKAAYPSRVTHSKQYRNPKKFKDQNVLIIGAGVSSLDICRELGGVAAKVYQSVRGGQFDLPASLLPPNATRVPGITKFTLDSTNRPLSLQESDPIPGLIHLSSSSSGLTLTLPTIHHVVLATGYITSYPFLPHLHSDTAPNTSASSAASEDDVLVVAREGDMAHHLHRDMFYIPDPTLAFVGVPYHVATFSLFDFQAQVVALVFAGRARLPSREAMRAEYARRVRERGLGRGFHSLMAEGDEIAYVQGLVDWVNEGVGEGKKEERMVPHSEEWKRAYREQKARVKALRSGGEEVSR